MPPRFVAFVKTICALAILAVAANPGAPFAPALHARLAQHVRQAATVEHNTSKSAAPQDAARYIEITLAALGYTVTRQQYLHDGKQVRNIEVSLINTNERKAPERIFIVGAHYDSAPGAPGGSGTAAVIELARMLKGIQLSQGTELKFVFFVDEEAPCSGSKGIGSREHETRYPSTGNFIAFVGAQASSELVRKALAAFRASSPLPAEGLAAASYVEGVTWSGHTSYNRHGYPAIMITDTAFLRYPYHHTAQDAPDKLDYASMARVVDGLAKVIAGLAAPVPM